MERIFQIVAVVFVGVAAYFLWQNNTDGVFVSVVLAAVSYLVSMRFQIRTRMKAREAENNKDIFALRGIKVKLSAVSELQHLLDNNMRWASRMTDENPRFFADLAEQQAPEYLWIGCSDSRVSANTIVDLAPGEVFVHRNVANLVNHTDMNCLSVIQFAVEVLKVKHIIVCGHYGCGGVIAALEGQRHGLIDNWLRHIQDTANHNAKPLAAAADFSERVNLLCEMNVCEQVVNVGETTIVQEAWQRGQDLTVTGWIYGLQDGLVRDLEISMKGEADLQELRQRFSTGGVQNTATSP